MGVGKSHGAESPSSPEHMLRSKRRKLNTGKAPASGRDLANAIDLTSDGDDSSSVTVSIKQPKGLQQLQSKPQSEKRLRVFRHHPPTSFEQRLVRAESQRMFVIDRRRVDTADSPKETVQLAGSTGNIYTVTIDKMPSCTCPDNVKGNQCKHIIYVVCNVLKATGKLRYQLAYLSSELKEIFDSVPDPTSISSKKHGSRKPIEGDCPICFTEFEPEKDDAVWCKEGCGNNVHKECFQQWAKSHPTREPRCVYCRALWRDDDGVLAAIREALSCQMPSGSPTSGYLNVADQLGISRHRDYSTYHQPWVTSRGRSVRYGNIF